MDLRMARILGACSPSTMCKNVMAENANAKEIDVITGTDSIPAKAKNGWSIRARKGSPSQPSPRLAAVIPTWQAER
jgi:hypothetical protein